jgi:hypothetical protein
VHLDGAVHAGLVAMLERLTERAVRSQPLSAQERDTVVGGIQRCYEQAGVNWHGRVVWAPSPAAGVAAVAAADVAVPQVQSRRWLPKRKSAPGPPSPKEVWTRIEERIRDAWSFAPFPLSMPGVLLRGEYDPLARIRSSIDEGLTREAGRPPPAKFDGSVDSRLTMMALFTSGHGGWPQVDDSVLAALVAASGAGPWWPLAGLTIVCEPPVEMHVEPVGHRPPVSYRLHRNDGPAVRWADDFAIYHVHGVDVPADLIESRWHGAAIHRHPNSEIRRLGIERIGWGRYITEAGWRLVADAPDPGNDPHRLRLYEDPTGREDLRILVMANGSPDRSGRPRHYAEAVPAHFADPVAAAAWQYGCPVRVYRRLKRRT